jgi:hypothetical protein
MLGWWNQAKDETPPEMVPLLVFSRNFVPQAVMFDDGQVFEACRMEGRPPWYSHPHFVFQLDDRELIITSLESFFKINPTLLGRRMP